MSQIRDSLERLRFLEEKSGNFTDNADKALAELDDLEEAVSKSKVLIWKLVMRFGFTEESREAIHETHEAILKTGVSAFDPKRRTKHAVLR